MASAAEDPFDLERFVRAQDPLDTLVRAELRSGRKTSHWMWFVFPQIQGLGHSAMAVKYALSSIAEAQAYLDHRVLGARLRACTNLVNAHADLTARAIFGAPDDMKFRSCMTLFAGLDGDIAPFQRALAIFFDNSPDMATQSLLAGSR